MYSLHLNELEAISMIMLMENRQVQPCNLAICSYVRIAIRFNYTVTLVNSNIHKLIIVIIDYNKNNKPVSPNQTQNIANNL